MKKSYLRRLIVRQIKGMIGIIRMYLRVLQPTMAVQLLLRLKWWNRMNILTETPAH